jgi:hypothetical protein
MMTRVTVIETHEHAGDFKDWCAIMFEISSKTKRATYGKA